MQNKKILSPHTNKRKGFTMTELLVVVAIIAVLVAVAIPVFHTQLEKSRNATDAYNATVIASTIQTYLTLDSDAKEKFVEAYGANPGGYRPYVIVTHKMTMISSDPTGILEEALLETGLLGKRIGVSRYDGITCQTTESWQSYTIGFTVIDGQVLVAYTGRADEKAVALRWTFWTRDPDSTGFRDMF